MSTHTTLPPETVELNLPVNEHAPRRGREFADEIATWASLGRERANDLRLLVSELVTNSVRASAGLVSPVVRLWLMSDRTRVLIQVSDRADEMPARQEAKPDSEAGRGLMLVAGLVSQWDSGRTDGGGKVTWAVV